jgi:N-acetylated-alpha-linked acidic dipeptidase
MGSGSDYSSFIQHVGIPSLNLGFGGEDPGGEYHSIYDSYDLYSRFKDPGFQYGVTLAETAGHAVLRMSQADELPFDYTHLTKTIDSYLQDLVKLMETKRQSTEMENQMIKSGDYAIAKDPTKPYVVPDPKSEVPFLDFSPLQNALKKLGTSVDSLNVVYQNNLKSGTVNIEFNQALYRSEQQLLSVTGLPRRSWYKHTLYAPGAYTGYGVKTMPGIREAIEQRNWKEVQEQIEVDANILDKLAVYFNRVTNKGSQ